MSEEKIDNWEEIKPKLKKEFPVLENEELEYKIGEEQMLLEKLQDKLKQDKHAIRSWLRIMG